MNELSRPTRVLAASFLPSAAVLELTYRCNHACLFCSCPWMAASGDYDIRDELDIPAWKAVVETLCARGVVDFAFTGGEPLLKTGVSELLSFAAQRTAHYVGSIGGRLDRRSGPPRLHLLTNGTLVSDAILQLCARHDIQLSMSLPGLETFAQHTGGHAPDTVLRWFAEAKRRGIRTTAGVTVTRLNLGELEATLCEALLAGADTILLNRFLPGGRGLDHLAALSLDQEEMRQMLRAADRVLCAANRGGSLGTELPKCVFGDLSLRRLEVSSRCAAAVAFFVVDPSGWLRVCNHSPERLTRVSELEALKTHPTWRRFALRNTLPASCRACADTTDCDGGCREAARVLTGRDDAPDPALCGVPR